jgi:hypothetical protein
VVTDNQDSRLALEDLSDNIGAETPLFRDFTHTEMTLHEASFIDPVRIGFWRIYPTHAACE